MNEKLEEPPKATGLAFSVTELRLCSEQRRGLQLELSWSSLDIYDYIFYWTIKWKQSNRKDIQNTTEQDRK